MGSDEFRNNLIYENLKDEFNTMCVRDSTTWKTFIKSKDLGIINLSYYDDEYIITDEKKWALAKIKYGF